MGEYFASAACASARLYAPFTAAAHRSVTKAMMFTKSGNEGSRAAVFQNFQDEWVSLNERLAALLASVTPAHRASSVQGSALLQAAHTWLRATSPPSGSKPALELVDMVRVLLLPTGTHFACTMGLVGAALELPQDVTLDAFGYASVRALIAGAIRLSLLGPQSAVGFQAAVSQSWAQAFSAAAREIEVAEAANTAPMLDVAHGLHDLLEARLFQT